MTEPVRSAREAARASARGMTALCVGASLFSLLFLLSYGYALHAPGPHHVRIDVVAATPSAFTADVRGLDKLQPGGFAVHPAANVTAARRDVRDGGSYGAIIEPTAGPIELFTASAAGLSVRQLITSTVTVLAQANGRSVRSVDLVPLPSGDRAGQSAFVFEIGLLIPGVIGSVGFYLLGRHVRVWVRVAAAAGYAILSAALGVLVLDVLLGALTGSPWTLMATATLVALAFVLTIAALHALLGLPGTAVAAGVLLVVGNAANGSSVPVPLLPGGYRQLALWLPNGAAVRAFRSDVYFSGHGQEQPMLTLALWVSVAVSIIVVADVLHLRRRSAYPADHEQIHATSVLSQILRRPAAGEPFRACQEDEPVGAVSQTISSPSRAAI